ncbi:MAG: hypothetical protein LZF63_11820 [Nitrosomonas sp.]|uniref:DUF6629 family protein n=1 Tax=Nitrosomonas sp. TaxID=42353 RepID=UPI0025E2F840|nr:DUF6629 family protein [Nitrosomonas sp.]MCG7757329.1 hypothetical protein [Nitrosomonas sp.]UJP01771.1 MAG: hypothetical protein LZF85_08170 [Nitrosomonas sp.]
MCFSAEASFIVSGTLFVVGITTIRKTVYSKDFPVALIPFIFAIQQLVEGLLWISLSHNGTAQSQFWLSNIYGVFIGIIWPLFAPFAVYQAETDNIRRKIIALIGVAGLGLAIYTAIGLADEPIIAGIIHHSINYKHHVSGYQLVIILYLLATCVPFIFSSYKHLYLAGIIIMAGFFVAYFTYLETFASVWCFFAAIASAFIYFYFVHRIKKPLIPIS